MSAAAIAAAGCASASGGSPAPKTTTAPALPIGLDPAATPAPFASTYRPLPGEPTAIVGATILTGAGEQIDGGVLVFADGRIVAVGKDLAPPAGARIIDGRGRWVTPGIIDVHAHFGASPSPSVKSLADSNEATDPVAAQVWVEHSVWPQDPQFNRARAGGVTTLQILPGSSNLFGGRSVVLKNVPSPTVQGMKFPGAAQGLKMACGENPKRIHGARGRAPTTRMGAVAGYRAAWINAADYARRWALYRAKAARGEAADPPKRDLQLDTLSGVLNGEILVQNHCYRADEMATMADLAHEFGYRITLFHHAVEAYKITEILRRENICIAVWADYSHTKMESYDNIAEDAAIAHRAGVCVVVHSDSAIISQHLNQEAALAMAAGNRAGLSISRAEAISWLTSNAARAIGVADRTGSLAPGKSADIVLWSADPFSVYALADKVFVDGGLAYDRGDPRFQPVSDFELGTFDEAAP